MQGVIFEIWRIVSGLGGPVPRGHGQRGMLALRAAVAFAMAGWAAAAFAIDIPGSTALVQFSVGNGLSTTAESLGNTPALLSDGTRYRLTRFYSSKWPDVSLTWVTELTSNTGLYWGFRTGERGRKYHIEPALNLGFIYIHQLSSRSAISLSAMTVLGGWLKETPCIADYGAIGGVQLVNCRLASSPLPPEETLKYLLNLPPVDRVRVSFGYVLKF